MPEGGGTRYGYDKKRGGWVIPEPSNMHTHFRAPNDPRFPIAVDEAAKLYRFVTAMPNLGRDRIRTPEQAIAYREAIHRRGRAINPRFTANVPLYLEPDTSPETVRKGFEQGAWIAAKLYPLGGTTGSAEGVDFQNLKALYPVFEAMQELQMKLLIHLEPTHMKTHGDDPLDPFERERFGLPILRDLLNAFPTLPIVFEHVSLAESADDIRQHVCRGRRLGATVAPQYLVWTRTDLFEGGISPGKYSIPVLKRRQDRTALRKLITSGFGFLGTDSAPHLLSAKSKSSCCPGGIFNEPTGLFTYFQIFKEEGEKAEKKAAVMGEPHQPTWLERFIEFACERGPAFYGLVSPKDKEEPKTVLIKKEPWEVPKLYGRGAEGIEPMHAGETVPYRLVRD